MWPMLVALTQFYPEGTLGYFTAHGNDVGWNKINNEIYCDSFSQSQKYFSSSLSYPLKNQNLKIAVLIGNRTSSSSEAVAISTKSISNARLFGSRTAGLTTANQPIEISEGEFLILTTAMDADRNKKEYPEGIPPDFNYPCNELVRGLTKWFKQ